MDTPIQPIHLFEQARLPARDAKGWVEHPDLARFHAVPLRDDEGFVDAQRLKEAGLTYMWVEFESDAPDAVRDAYDANPAAGAPSWGPTPPTDRCLLAGIWECEFGPVAYFVFPVSP
ncbi:MULTISPECIES: hypothetical protein [Luteibacter]|uniref:hypothetical protein n=1 Tax=Luteibacter TaxID=242605 RepID=UPI00056D4B81|nr:MULTISPECIES: hypothetical protein [unclassified Luteibacter]